MITSIVRDHVHQVTSTPGSGHRVAERVTELASAQNAGLGAADRDALVAQLELYVTGTADLLDLAVLEAAERQISPYVDPIVEAAANYFLDPLDTIPDHEGLLGLLDDAYLAQSLLIGLSLLHVELSGVPLIGASLAPATAVVRGVIGEPVASQLDALVGGTVQQVAAQVQLDALAAHGATLASPTGGPGAWGGAWEDEMSRIGAEAGISINW